MDFEVNLDRNVRRRIFFGKVCPRVDGSDCTECNKAAEFYRAANNTTSKDERNRLMETARQLYARSRIFVNAIDTQDEDKSYPVRIYALPPSTYDDLMRQVKGLTVLDPGINIVHPFKGRNVLITKTGQGVQTRYSVQIDTRDTEIPNKQLLEQFKVGDLSGLHNLNNIIEFIEQNYLHIKQLDNEMNVIRLLPPFDDTKVLYAEVKFHRFTADYILNQDKTISGDSISSDVHKHIANVVSDTGSSIIDEYDPFAVSDEVNATKPFIAPQETAFQPSEELNATPVNDAPPAEAELDSTTPTSDQEDPLANLDVSNMSKDTIAKLAERMKELKTK